jgi:hypothetical protein
LGLDDYSISKLQEKLESLRHAESLRLQKEIEELRNKLDLMEEKLRVLLGSSKEQQPRRTLKDTIIAVLESSIEPLTVTEIAELVVELGYRSNSRSPKKNLPGMVQQCLLRNSGDFRRANRSRPCRFTLK